MKSKNIKRKYFEDIFKKIRPLWKQKYIVYILNENNKNSFFHDYISDDYDQIDYVLIHQKGDYDEWDSMLVFTFYRTLYNYAKVNFNKKIIDIDDIPIEKFEKDYLANLREEGNEEYLNKYLGLNKDSAHEQ